MDFVQGLDPFRLVVAETALSFLLSPFTAPPYNLPIFLFGVYALDNKDNARALQLFTGLLGASALFDVIWMISSEQHFFAKLLTVILFLFKLPTFLASAATLRDHGFVGLEGQTVWSMPGGLPFGEREGYQVVEEGGLVRPSKPTTPPANRSGQAHTPPGAYQTV